MARKESIQILVLWMLYGHCIVTLLSIYDKKNISNVSDKYIESLVKEWELLFGQ